MKKKLIATAALSAFLFTGISVLELFLSKLLALNRNTSAAIRISAAEFLSEIEETEKAIRSFLV